MQSSRKHKAKAPPAVCTNYMTSIMMSVYWFYLCVSVYLPPLLRVLWSGPLQQTEALGCPQILQRRVTLSPLSHTTSLRGTMNSGGTAASNSETYSHLVVSLWHMNWFDIFREISKNERTIFWFTIINVVGIQKLKKKKRKKKVEFVKPWNDISNDYIMNH